MSQGSEIYAWLLDNPVGAYVVVEPWVADQVMLNTGGLLYRDDLWHSIKHEVMSPGAGNLYLVATPYKDRIGTGPFVSLGNRAVGQ